MSNLSSSPSSSSSRLLGAIQGSSTLHNSSKVNYGKRKTKKESVTTSGSESMIVVGDERKQGSKKKNLTFDHKLLQLKQRHHLSSRAVSTAVKLDKEQLKSRRKQGFTLAPPIIVAPNLLQCSDPNKYPAQTIDSHKTSIDDDPPGPQHEEVKQLFELADGLLHGEEDRAPPGLKPKNCSSKAYISIVSRNRFEGLQSDDLSDSDDDDRHLHSYNSFPMISIKPALFQLPTASRVSADPLDDL
jgi:hypothetical protein